MAGHFAQADKADDAHPSGTVSPKRERGANRSGGLPEGDGRHFGEALLQQFGGVAGEGQLRQHARSRHATCCISLQALVEFKFQVARGRHGPESLSEDRPVVCTDFW